MKKFENFLDFTKMKNKLHINNVMFINKYCGLHLDESNNFDKLKKEFSEKVNSLKDEIVHLRLDTEKKRESMKNEITSLKNVVVSLEDKVNILTTERNLLKKENKKENTNIIISEEHSELNFSNIRNKFQNKKKFKNVDELIAHQKEQMKKYIQENSNLKTKVIQLKENITKEEKNRHIVNNQNTNLKQKLAPLNLRILLETLIQKLSFKDNLTFSLKNDILIKILHLNVKKRVNKLTEKDKNEILNLKTYLLENSANDFFERELPENVINFFNNTNKSNLKKLMELYSELSEKLHVEENYMNRPSNKKKLIISSKMQEEAKMINSILESFQANYNLEFI